ncbi:MAG: hypothetical protein RLZZ352_2689 [Pseudomonadota bacterium]|jgi:hypothetical protein
MSVLSHLTNTASNAVLSDNEKSSISTSISTLQTRLKYHFSNIDEHFQFGSSTRGTILPRKMDGNSDIDYIIVFNDAGFTPQTYLTRLKGFAEKYYSTSEIYQSHPTIVLELNHIKFELVPATKDWWGTYKIPNGSGGWMTTDPNDFNSTLTSKNKDHNYLIKPTIRILKYWNAINSYPYSSYALEKKIVDMDFMWVSSNQKNFVFYVFEALPTWEHGTQWRIDVLTKAKKIIQETKRLEAEYMPYSASLKIQELIP